jgi:hypothetical protein
MIIYGKDFSTLANTDSCIISVYEKRIKCDDYEYFIVAETSGGRFALTRCSDEISAHECMDAITVAALTGWRGVTVTRGKCLPYCEAGPADRIADSLDELRKEMRA